MKQIKLAVIALLATLTFAACSDDNNESPTIIDPNPVDYTQTAYIINQGNMYSKIDGTIDRLSLTPKDTTYTAGAFAAVNGQSLGSTPENAVVYGSHLYVPMNGDNLLWVLNAHTLKLEKQIITSQPMGVCAAAGNVFVTNYDGNVTCIDTLTLTEKAKTAVGPNPEQVVSDGQYVYTSISDGMNYTNNYANGKKIAVLDAHSGKLVKHIDCGLNPGPLAVDATGSLYVVARGNYADVLPTVQKVNTGTGTVSNICEGNLVATDADRLYVLYTSTDWTTGASTTTFTFYTTTATGKEVSRQGTTFVEGDNLPALPSFIDVDHKTGTVYVGSDKSTKDYDKQGWVYMYSKDGRLLRRIDAGVHPYAVAFVK